jgi:ataxia telangiectasia mutated family protein
MMYETIFRASLAEKHLFKQQAKSKHKKPLGTRFQACGSVLRAGVELGVQRLKIKTVRAVYNHIIDTLPCGEGDTFCEPISIDYVKALRVLFGYPPHTEHLAGDWEIVAKFCCTHVGSQLGLVDRSDIHEEGDGIEEVGEEMSRMTEARSKDSISTRTGSLTSRRSMTSTSQHHVARLSHESEELLMCLHHLLSAPNAPILLNAEMICETLLGFLRSQPSLTRAHQYVFSSLNYVLNVLTTNDIELVSRVSDEILPAISMIWETKMPGLKDEMVISLVYCLPYIRARLGNPEMQSLRSSVENLFDNICNEYISRSDREILQLDDVEFPSPLRKFPSQDPLSLPVISLRTNPQNFRTEQIWMVPSLIAMMIEMLDASNPDKLIKVNNENDNRLKRLRMYNRFEEIMRLARSTNASHRLLALQVIPFLANSGGINQEKFSFIIQDLYEACTDDNHAITGWALVAIGR